MSVTNRRLSPNDAMRMRIATAVLQGTPVRQAAAAERVSTKRAVRLVESVCWLLKEHQLLHDWPALPAQTRADWSLDAMEQNRHAWLRACEEYCSREPQGEAQLSAATRSALRRLGIHAKGQARERFVAGLPTPGQLPDLGALAIAELAAWLGLPPPAPFQALTPQLDAVYRHFRTADLPDRTAIRHEAVRLLTDSSISPAHAYELVAAVVDAALVRMERVAARSARTPAAEQCL